MGLLSKVFGRARTSRQAVALAPVPATRRGFRRLYVEQMEERRLMTASPITLGAVYFDPGTGFDETANTFRVSYIGGAAGTELKTLTINTDKDGNGKLDPAETFFDTASGGLGVYGFHPFAQVDNASGIIINSFSVADGGTLLTLNLSGFTAGKTLVFTIDVDEMGSRGVANAVAEGAEFEFSNIAGTFSAPHYFNITGNADFHDEFDPLFAGRGLNLPNDDYSPISQGADPVLTAGALFDVAQPPMPSSLSGFVFDDTDIDNTQDPGELGIGGVSLTLKIWNGAAYVDLPVVTTTTTAADGSYKFDGLAPGKYRVVETQPSGYFSVGARAGTVDGVTDGVVTTVDIISDVVLEPDQKSVHNDYAEARPAQISGYVYSDINNNGVKDPGEIGIANTTVHLLDAALNEVGTTQTDATGFYKFTNLFPGAFTIAEDQPGGYLDGKDAVGTGGGGILVPPDGMTNIVLLSGANGVNYNFGEILPGKITGMVHADRNGDCVYQQGEPLLANVTIELRNSQGQVIATTKTDVNGKYEFDQLPPGSYTVHEVQPAGYFQGGNMLGTAGGAVVDIDTLGSIVMTPGLQALDYNFCEEEPASIAGMVHADRNGDCMYQEGEPLLAGVTIQLKNSQGQIVATTVTDSQGKYKFSNLEPGTYTVHEVQPAGYFQGGNSLGSVGGIVVDTDTMTTLLNPAINGFEYNFCEQEPASIAGMVHADRNGDCMYQEGEPLLAGVTIQLKNSQGQIVATTVTDSQGKYKFSNLEPGTYTVHEVQPAGYFQGGNSLGSVGGIVVDTDTMTTLLNPAINGVEYNFCEQEPASIAGIVHADRNGDCMYQEGEPLLAGVTIQLRNSQGQVVATTVTDAQGKYKFSNLEPGVYTVHEVQPAGYYQGGNSLGSVGGIIVDIDTMTTLLNAAINGVEYNFCEQEPASIAGRVHVDTDGDCMYDPGEQLLANVTIQLINDKGQVVATTKTDANGDYNFANLAPGTYTVHEVQPAGYFQGGNSLGSVGGTVVDVDTLGGVTLGANVNGVNYDFCEIPPGSIAGMIHVDKNGDCIYQPGEPLLAGVTVQLISNGQVVATTVTDEMGQYKFSNLAPGTYTVHELQPAGYYQGGNSLGSIGGVVLSDDTLGAIELGAGVNATDYDFCEKLPGSISGMIHVDNNGDCIYQPGEPLLAGVTVQLIDSSGQVVATTVTDAMGEYSFKNLAPGAYTVHEVQPTGYSQGGNTIGSIGGVIVDADTLGSIILGAGIDAVDYNFCEQAPTCISGYVFIDPNHNGRLDSNEQPLPGVIVQLLNSSGVVIASTSTDSSGYYQFCGIEPGTYGVHEIQPTGLIDDFDYVGTAGGFLDNDLVTQITLTLGQQATQYNFTEQLYIIPPEQPGTFVPLNPMALPPVPQYLVQITPTPAPYIPLSLYYGGGYVLGYTWHLSVIDAGRPRSDQLADGRVATISTGNDPFQQSEGPVHEAQWLLGMPGKDEDGVETSQIVRFGMRNGIPVTGDFNGDGLTDVGFYYNGHWYIDLNGNSHWDGSDLWAKLGNDGDKPVTGDWDGDGKTDIGIFGRAWPGDPYAIKQEPGLPSADNHRHTGKQKNVPPTAHQAAMGYRTMKHTAQGDYRKDVIDHVFHYGTPGDIPLTGDWHGTGIHTIGLFHKGNWILDTDADGRWTDGDTRFVYGQDGDIPVVGDFNGDGLDELGVYRNGVWYIDTNGDRVLDAHDRVFQLGGAGDTPVVGDWNGDGVDEPGVYQPGPNAVANAKK